MGVVRPDRGAGEQWRCRCSNSQRGTGTKYTATGQDRRRFRHVYLQWEMGEPFGLVELIHVLQPLACRSCASSPSCRTVTTAYQRTWGGAPWTLERNRPDLERYGSPERPESRRQL